MQSKIVKPDRHRIFIGLGSNLGDCAHNLEVAVQAVTRIFNTIPVLSCVYRSEPVEVKEQPWFMNQVIYCDIDNNSPTSVLWQMKEIERAMGRVPNYRYGPRLIDLDLLFFDNWVFKSNDLEIPHPKIAGRSFVLLPLAEIAPGFQHPVLLQTISQLAARKIPALSKCEKVE